MKKMKWLLLGAALTGILAGCGANAPATEEIEADAVAGYVEAARAMLEEADSFAADFRAEVQMEGSEKTVTEGSVEFVKEPFFMKVDTDMDFGGFSQEYDVYLEKAEDAVNQYMSYDGEWTEMTLTEDAALVGTQIYHTLYNMEAILTAAENWTAEKVDGDLVLSGSIPEEKFYDVESYTRWFQMAGMSGLSEVYYAGIGDVPVVVTLDEKTGEPLSYEVDLAKPLEIMTNNVLTEMNGGTLQEGITVVSYKIVSELTQLGGVEVTPVPEEAKSDAINYEKEISMMESAE